MRYMLPGNLPSAFAASITDKCIGRWREGPKRTLAVSGMINEILWQLSPLRKKFHKVV